MNDTTTTTSTTSTTSTTNNFKTATQGTAPAFRQIFHPGRVVATPAVMSALRDQWDENALVKTGDLITRHLCGDDGDLSAEDKKANREALRDGERIFSAYNITPDLTVWIITEAVGDDGDRFSTCLMLPGDY